ncbi:MAG: hypothetical protein ABEH65_02410 [Halobacteriales archaeon]
MCTNRSIAIGLACLVLLSTMPTGVVAQGTSADPVVLTEYERAERVIVDGTTYRVYTVESPLPFVDGIAVYRNGRSVESESVVKRVVAVHARQTAVAGLRSDEMAILRRLKQESETIEKRVPELIAEINVTITYTEKLNGTTIDNRTARELAIERIPAFEEEFEVGYGAARIEQLRKSLMRLETAARNLNENATAVITLVEQRRNGTEIDKTELFRHYVATISALERTETLVDDLKYPLSETADHMTAIANQSDRIPSVESPMEQRFTAVANEFKTTREALLETKKRLTSDRKTLQKVDRRAEAIRERLMKQWISRGALKAKIYSMLGEATLLAIAGLWTGLSLREA